MIPSPEEWRKSTPPKKYDGIFKFVLDITKRKDIRPVAQFLCYDVCGQSEETNILRIGSVDVGECSVERCVQLLEELCSEEQ
jgi:hypothetical protein